MEKIGKMGGGGNSQSQLDYFSLERSQMLKGVLAISIVLNHLARGTDVVWVFDRFFSEIGFPIVTVFFFITGYGWSYVQKLCLASGNGVGYFAYFRSFFLLVTGLVLS
ncbi:MAG: hypothetical protein LBN39_01160 [Planctomycetaceae bacterium]|jgi:hypothetical protein|nr:hypothetical protein [Planctomycetaceae bacterium]